MAYSDSLRENLDMMADEELLSRVKAGTLTAEAQKIAIQLLSARGRSVEDETTDASSPSREKKKPKESDRVFLGRCIAGKASLNDAFWVLGLGVWLAIGAPVAVLASLTKETPLGPVVSVLGGLLLLIALTFRDICIWRCAPNAKWIAWGVIARTWVALSWFLFVASLFERGR